MSGCSSCPDHRSSPDLHLPVLGMGGDARECFQLSQGVGTSPCSKMTGTPKLGSPQSRPSSFHLSPRLDLVFCRGESSFINRVGATLTPRPLLSLVCAHTCCQPLPQLHPARRSRGEQKEIPSSGRCQGSLARECAFLDFHYETF